MSWEKREICLGHWHLLSAKHRPGADRELNTHGWKVASETTGAQQWQGHTVISGNGFPRSPPNSKEALDTGHLPLRGPNVCLPGPGKPPQLLKPLTMKDLTTTSGIWGSW